MEQIWLFTSGRKHFLYTILLKTVVYSYEILFSFRSQAVDIPTGLRTGYKQQICPHYKSAFAREWNKIPYKLADMLIELEEMKQNSEKIFPTKELEEQKNWKANISDLFVQSWYFLNEGNVRKSIHRSYGAKILCFVYRYAWDWTPS